MRPSCLLWNLIAILALSSAVGARMWSSATQEPPQVPAEARQISPGEFLFNHEWEVNDPLCPDGDGLGPVFNARSCVACHNQGGPGGSGGTEHNVTTFVVVPDDPKAPTSHLAIPTNYRNNVFRADARTLPRQGVVHTFATEARFQATFDWFIPSGNEGSSGKILITEAPDSRSETNATVHLSQRKTPALFGAGLIDSIPDHVIIAAENQQRLHHSKIRIDVDNGTTLETGTVGRVHRLADGQIGRFGWQAQTARLADFVQAACATELGLGNATHAQAKSLAEPAYSPRGLDLSQKQCDDLTAFVASLPRPVERLPPLKRGEAHYPRLVDFGREVFNTIGCADCHTPSVGSVVGIYSDLLLHRMGDKLKGGVDFHTWKGQPATPADTVAAEPMPDEWRTPPLWGVADSAPYMHDGASSYLGGCNKDAWGPGNPVS